MRLHSPWQIRLLGFLGFCVFWWFVLSNYLIRSGSYWPVISWVVITLSAGFWHVRALWRFNKMLKAVHRDEHLGLAEPGSTAFAANQRFRYLVRVVENLVALAIGAAGIYSVTHPGIAAHPWYQRLVITFFIGSIAATGYLTIRDLRVINMVQKKVAQGDIALGRPELPNPLPEAVRKRLEEALDLPREEGTQ